MSTWKWEEAVKYKKRNLQHLSARSSEDAWRNISHEKGSLYKLCLWSWGSRSSELSLIKGFTFAEAYTKSNQYTCIAQKYTTSGDEGVECYFFPGCYIMHHGLQLPFISIRIAWSCDSRLWERSGLSSLVCAGSSLWQAPREKPLHVPHAVRLSLAVYALADCRASERKVDREQGCSGCSCTSWCV